MYNVRLGHDRRKAGINRLQPNVDETIPWPGRRVGNVLDPQTHGYIPSAVPPAVGHFECKKARRQGARTVVRACIDQRLVSPLSLFLSLAIFSLHMRFVLEGANKMARDKSSIHSFDLNNNQHLVLIPFPLFFDLYLRLSSSWTFYPDISYPYPTMYPYFHWICLDGTNEIQRCETRFPSLWKVQNEMLFLYMTRPAVSFLSLFALLLELILSNFYVHRLMNKGCTCSTSDEMFNPLGTQIHQR